MEKIELFVPGRLGIIGEISDLVSPYLSINKELIYGHAISMPIDMGIYSTSIKSEKLIYKAENKYFETDISEESLIEQIEARSFYAYICGTILYLKRNYKVSGIQLQIDKINLPVGKGLSSSAAICITVAKAYNGLYDLNLSDSKIKEIAYEGEHLAKSQCGRLDQESIMNNGICHIVFTENQAQSIPISVKENIYTLAVDLNAQRNTRTIMNAFNSALPFPKNSNDKLIHDIIGEKNKRLVEMAEKSIKTGNIEMLGYSLTEAQKLMDKAAPVCREYYAPVLHSVIEDSYVHNLSYGGKSTGAGGDGIVILICKNSDAQKELNHYIKEKFHMTSIQFCINKTE